MGAQGLYTDHTYLYAFMELNEPVRTVEVRE